MNNAVPRDQLERFLEQATQNLTSIQKRSSQQTEEIRALRAELACKNVLIKRALNEGTSMAGYGFVVPDDVMAALAEPKAGRSEEIRDIDAQVREFHDVMGIENRETLGVPSDQIVRLRMRLVIEEAFEFLLASSADGPCRAAYHAMVQDVLDLIDVTAVNPDLVEVADACADLDYVVAGTRLAYGIPRKPVADEVHRSNMAKAPGGKVYRDAHGKVTKPPGWTPPDIKGVLALADREK